MPCTTGRPALPLDFARSRITINGEGWTARSAAGSTQAAYAAIPADVRCVRGDLAIEASVADTASMRSTPSRGVQAEFCNPGATPEAHANLSLVAKLLTGLVDRGGFEPPTS